MRDELAGRGPTCAATTLQIHNRLTICHAPACAPGDPPRGFLLSHIDIFTAQALACGTPVVTAGALQSVHRLAEGMITAAATAATTVSAAEGARYEVCHGRAARYTNGTGSTERDPIDPEGERSESVGAKIAGIGVDTVGGGDDGIAVVESLVASTAAEYVEKAVAVAAPGSLRERVRRALACGREGMLHEGGIIATDWERFLKNAAASSTAKKAATTR